MISSTKDTKLLTETNQTIFAGEDQRPAEEEEEKEEKEEYEDLVWQTRGDKIDQEGPKEKLRWGIPSLDVGEVAYNLDRMTDYHPESESFTNIPF